MASTGRAPDAAWRWRWGTSYQPFVDLSHGIFTATDAVQQSRGAEQPRFPSELSALRAPGLLAVIQIEGIGRCWVTCAVGELR